MSSVINDTNLPKCFINKIISPTNDDGITVVRSGIQSMADITKWIKEFGQNTNTHWILSKTVKESQRIVCSKQYVCQYSSSRKAKEKNRGASKDSLCQAKINFQVKLNTSYTRASDLHIREGLCGVIVIKSKHSHAIEPEDTLRFVAINSPLKDIFFGYFNSGLGVVEALKRHTRKLELAEINNNLCNGAVYGRVNPTERIVRYWYDHWKKLENLKRRTEIAINKASASGALSSSPTTLLSSALQGLPGYHNLQTPPNIRQSDAQAEYVEQEVVIIKNEDVKDEVRMMINQSAGDPLDNPSFPDFQVDSRNATDPSQRSFVESNVKVNLSPTSALNNGDETSKTSQTVLNDESLAFGEYVGLSLSRMDEYVRSVVIHKISKVIYEADMGLLDKEADDSKNTDSKEFTSPTSRTTQK